MIIFNEPHKRHSSPSGSETPPDPATPSEESFSPDPVRPPIPPLDFSRLQRPSHSFYLRCLVGIAIGAGGTLLVFGMVCSSLAWMGVGIGVLVTVAISFATTEGLFARKITMNETLEENTPQTPLTPYD